MCAAERKRVQEELRTRHSRNMYLDRCVSVCMYVCTCVCVRLTCVYVLCIKPLVCALVELLKICFRNLDARYYYVLVCIVNRTDGEKETNK